MKKKILIDASNIKSTGGIVHLNSILKSYKKNKSVQIEVLVNKKAFNNLEVKKYTNKIKFIFNKAFEINFFTIFIWQILF